MKFTQRGSTPVLEENILDTILDIQMYKTEMRPVYGRGRRKFIRDRNNIPTPGGRTEQDIEARPTTEVDPIIITVVDQSGNTDLIKTELLQTINPNDNQIEPVTKTLARIN